MHRHSIPKDPDQSREGDVLYTEQEFLASGFSCPVPSRRCRLDVHGQDRRSSPDQSDIDGSNRF